MSEDRHLELDPEVLRAWLSDVIGVPLAEVSLNGLGGHSSGAWALDARSPDGSRRSMVLKMAPATGVVYQRDAVAEAKLMRSLHRLGAPVPEVLAIDSGSGLGTPAFVMAMLAGRGVEDAGPAGYHADAGLTSASSEDLRAIWESFYDSLASLHNVDVSQVPDDLLGRGGLREVIGHWRESLLDVARAEAVPRQLAILNLLEKHLPADAEEEPAVCMGDARLVNGLIDGTSVTGLVDFEVAYIGNPAADVGYGVFLDNMQRGAAEKPLELPSPDETWRRWAKATDRPDKDREYWTAFGAMVLCVTVTRAMVQWGLAGQQPEASNPAIAAWEAVAAAASH